jgi:molybdopterin synthase catalytic subunit
MTAHTQLTTAAIDVASLIGRVSDHGCGAVATFLGTVRHSSDGRPVLRLDYEAYAPMAEAELQRIARSVRRRHGLHGVAIVHRVGSLLPGDLAVAVVTASPHRAAALAACADAIELVKRDVPIWKREHHPDGAVWVQAQCSNEQAHGRATADTR